MSLRFGDTPFRAKMLIEDMKPDPGIIGSTSQDVRTTHESLMNPQPTGSDPHPDGAVPGREWSRRDFLRTGLATVGTCAGLSSNTAAAAATAAADNAPEGLAFLVVSDTHYTALEGAPEQLDRQILEVNRRLIDLLNQLPGQTLPASMGGGRIRRARGVLHLGDMIDSGDKGTGPVSVRRQATEWRSYVGDFGLTRSEGRLKYPVYEIHGNHDSVRETNVVISGLIQRNKARPDVTHVSANGLHYSWDWDGIHFIALGIVVGHNDGNLPVGRYQARDSLQFLKLDLETKVGLSGRPVILLHHIDLLRYSKKCGPDSERGGEWSACDVAAYHRAIRSYRIAAIFHGHLHALRTDRWNGSDRNHPEGIPVFGTRNSGAAGANRGFFHCSVEGGELVVREMTCLGASDGWLDGAAEWKNEWKVPLRA